MKTVAVTIMCAVLVLIFAETAIAALLLGGRSSRLRTVHSNASS